MRNFSFQVAVGRLVSGLAFASGLAWLLGGLPRPAQKPGLRARRVALCGLTLAGSHPRGCGQRALISYSGGQFSCDQEICVDEILVAWAIRRIGLPIII